MAGFKPSIWGMAGCVCAQWTESDGHVGMRIAHSTTHVPVLIPLADRVTVIGAVQLCCRSLASPLKISSITIDDFF